MKTVARVFKIGGNDLGKPLGEREKSVVGVDESGTPHKGKNLKGILFDRYNKIPKPPWPAHAHAGAKAKGNKLMVNRGENLNI